MYEFLTNITLAQSTLADSVRSGTQIEKQKQVSLLQESICNSEKSIELAQRLRSVGEAEVINLKNTMAIAKYRLGGKRNSAQDVREAIALTHECGGVWSREKLPDRWASLQNNLGSMHRTLASICRDENYYADAAMYYKECLEVGEKEHNGSFFIQTVLEYSRTVIQNPLTTKTDLLHAKSLTDKVLSMLGLSDEKNKQISHLSKALDELISKSGEKEGVKISNADVESLLTNGMELGIQGRISDARANFSKIIDMNIHDGKHLASAHFNMGVTYMLEGDVETEIKYYTSAIELGDPLSHQRALALVNRGVAYSRINRPQDALRDLTSVIDESKYEDQIGLALISRSAIYFQSGKSARGYSDLKQIISDNKYTASQKERAYLNRGHSKKLENKLESALEDYKKVLNSKNIGRVADALLSIASVRSLLCDRSGELEAYENVLNLKNVPDGLLAKAKTNKASLLAGDSLFDIAEELFSDVIEENVDQDSTVLSLKNRGKIRATEKNIEQALSDYTAAIDLMDIQDDQYLPTLIERSQVFLSLGKQKNALMDLSVLIKSAQSANSEIVLDAIVSRSHISNQIGEYMSAINDAKYVIRNEYSSKHHMCVSFINQGTAHTYLNNIKHAFESYKQFLNVQEIKQIDRIIYTTDMLNELNQDLLRDYKFIDSIRELILDSFSEKEVSEIRRKVSSQWVAILSPPIAS